jgi:undecaprenyl-diphosphatase
VALLLALAALTVLVATGPDWFTRAEHWSGSSALATTREHPTWRAFWLIDATAEQPTTFRLLLLAGAIALLVRRQRRLAAWLATVLVLSLAVAAVAKEVLQRARPTWADPVTAAGGYSYPSGHATAAWTASTVAVLLVLALGRRHSTRCGVTGLAVLTAVVVSLDRVFLGVHYPSDVVAGALLGAVVAFVPWLVVVRPTSWTVERDPTR